MIRRFCLLWEVARVHRSRPRSALWALLCCVGLGMTASLAQPDAGSEPESDTQVLEPVVRELFGHIERLSDYRATQALPPIYVVPQHVIEAQVCDTPCNVTAAYLPRAGIYLSGNLDPARETRDRAALLHELVHWLQQGHPKFAHLTGCARERAKEAEAYAIQNAYLEMLDSPERAVFYDGEFDCDVPQQDAQR
jgi:hypothetical protein